MNQINTDQILIKIRITEMIIKNKMILSMSCSLIQWLIKKILIFKCKEKTVKKSSL
jgi:hypothetical protein